MGIVFISGRGLGRGRWSSRGGGGLLSRGVLCRIKLRIVAEVVGSGRGR